MTKYRCKNCGYKFEGEKKDKCPYCGKESMEKEKSAGELVDDVRSR